MQKIHLLLIPALLAFAFTLLAVLFTLLFLRLAFFAFLPFGLFRLLAFLLILGFALAGFSLVALLLLLLFGSTTISWRCRSVSAMRTNPRLQIQTRSCRSSCRRRQGVNDDGGVNDA